MLICTLLVSWHDCAKNNLALSWNESPSITIVSSVIVYIWRKCLIMIIGIDKSSESSLDYQCWMRRERERRTFIQHAERNQRAMSCHDYLWILGCCCCCWHIIILTSLQSSQSDLEKMHLYFCSSVIRVSSEYCPSMVQVVQVFVPAIWKGGSSLSSLYCPRILLS